MDWKAIQKLSVTIIFALYIYFDRTSRKNYEKYIEQCYDQWYLCMLLNMYNY